VSARAWAGPLACAGLTAVGSLPALAVHVSTDAPLAIACDDVQRYREAGEDVVFKR
jgi:hypothetical protein